MNPIHTTLLSLFHNEIISLQQPISTKNKWLNPTDEFGKMEGGTVYESRTYERKISFVKDSDFELL